jgi:flagellar motility protein MotE (MotC chaperone)
MVMLKRVAHAIAWLALAHLFAVGGLVAYLFASGRLNSERVEQIATVLRGEFPKPQVVASRPAEHQQKPQTSREELAQLESRKRLQTLISERHQREIDDRNSLNQSIQFDINRQLERIEEQKEEFQKEKRQTQEALEQTGFQHALDIYSEMDPKLAKDVLISKRDPDVVQIFVSMDPGKRKKIVNACKTPEEKAWVGRILTHIGKLDELHMNALGDDGTAGAES